MLRLTVNGQPRTLERPMSILEFLQSLGVNLAIVAVGYNGEVLDRQAWATTVLQDGDVLEIVRPVGGG
ncbi:MAG: sulfur carrier protein ThiS [Dehalococcoidia bacterium]|nr:sulfur carrier protein ThiS [Dehalococcoidia bacterium]MDW8120253.1 sulfur carrier protein ThiS [Chloroflexota bacterium]